MLSHVFLDLGKWLDQILFHGGKNVETSKYISTAFDQQNFFRTTNRLGLVTFKTFVLFWWAKSWCVCLLPGHEAQNGHGEAPIHSDTLKLHSLGTTTRKADAFHLCLYWIAWLLQIPVLNLRKGVHPLQTKNVFLLIANLCLQTIRI